MHGHVETAAYFVVAEALTNIAKYAGATKARVTVARKNSNARIEIRDDGNGGVTPDHGSGLRGLADRVGDRQLTIESSPGQGTRIIVEIPCARGPGRSGISHDSSSRSDAGPPDRGDNAAPVSSSGCHSQLPG